MIQTLDFNISSTDNQIQSLINKLNTYQLEILSYCSNNNLPVFNFIRLTNFSMYHSETVYSELEKLNKNIYYFMDILNKNPLFKPFSPRFISYARLMFKIIIQLQTIINFSQNHNLFVMTREKNLENFNLNLIHKQISFPNTFQKDNEQFLTKLSNMPFEENKYLISISEFYKSSNFLVPLKSKDNYLIFQKTDTIGFKNDKYVFYSNSKDEFLNKLFSIISSLDNKKYSFLKQKPKLFSILIYSSYGDRDNKKPPVSNEEHFLKVA